MSRKHIIQMSRKHITLFRYGLIGLLTSLNTSRSVNGSAHPAAGKKNEAKEIQRNTVQFACRVRSGYVQTAQKTHTIL